MPALEQFHHDLPQAVGVEQQVLVVGGLGDASAHCLVDAAVVAVVALRAQNWVRGRYVAFRPP